MIFNNPIVRKAVFVMVIVFSIIVAYGGIYLKSIQVSYIGEGKEHQDKYLPYINDPEKAPDYGIQVRVNDKWKLFSQKNNIFIASNPITFEANQHFPVKIIEEVRLFDDDKLENDILETHTLKKGKFNGENYSFDVTYGFSFLAGVEYFWNTAIGKAILGGITIGMVILILGSF